MLRTPSKAKKALPADSEPVDPVTVLSDLERLIGMLDGFYRDAKRMGHTNRTLTGPAFESIRKNREHLVDYATALNAYLDSRAHELFESARREFLQGETVSLSALDD